MGHAGLEGDEGSQVRLFGGVVLREGADSAAVVASAAKSAVARAGNMGATLGRVRGSGQERGRNAGEDLEMPGCRKAETGGLCAADRFQMLEDAGGESSCGWKNRRMERLVRSA